MLRKRQAKRGPFNQRILQPLACVEVNIELFTMANQSKVLDDEIYDSNFETELEDSDKENQVYRSAMMEDFCLYVVDEEDDDGTVKEVVQAEKA